ncbi:MAG TPA: primosomal protein N', partial [Planctomycetota bacterium]|nr:primosomal protein N' [Planctomycetota bacterium]
DGDRADAWRAVRAGEIDVVVGARSALFAPLPRLGIIVVDEEHESAFKQESTPRYHARDVAMELARLSNAVLILGSATPSFEALHAARTSSPPPLEGGGRGRGLGHLHLSARVAGRPLPPVEIIDMGRENKDTGRYNYLSERLVREISRTLSSREQTILFMNRRGFSTVITCLRCGFTEKCEHCDITLTSHRGSARAAGSMGGRGDEETRGTAQTRGRGDARTRGVGRGELLLCHYCGYEKPLPDVCSGCGSPGVKHWGMGTERVEAEVRKVFPNARVARMDSDTMTKRTAYLEALAAFRSGQTDILIGTQMIAKGLDFPNVTLVGVVLADTALHMPDFRSRERTFQLLAQVAGRAGRGEKGGRVIIQTHLPDDPAIKAAAKHDFEAFALNELQERRAFLYPPFTRLARILLRGKEQGKTREAAALLADTLKAESAKQAAGTALKSGAPPPTLILGPSEPPIARLEGMFRQHIMIKARDSETLAALLHGPAGTALHKLRGADAVVDVDPLSML